MLQVKFARSLMERENGINHLWVKVSPAPVADEQNKKPVAFVLVIDNSGSMDDYAERYVSHRLERSATKLTFVKNAAERLVDVMRDGEYIGIVSFSDMARIEYPLTALSRVERMRVKDRIRSIRTEGSTNISDGLAKGKSLIPESLKETHHVKMILLSDGEANRGITNIDRLASIVKGYRNDGVSISTIGVGIEYNSYFMETIATVSGGMFFHLTDLAQLDSIFTQELDAASRVLAKNATLKVTCGVDLELGPNLNGFFEEQGTVFLGNLYGDQEVVFEMSTTKAQNDAAHIRVTLEYESASAEKHSVTQELSIPLVSEDEVDNATIDPEVTQCVRELLKAKAQKEAVRFFEEGSVDMSASVLEESLRVMESIGEAYHMDLMEPVHELQELKSSIRSRKLDKDTAKRVYSQSFNVSRGKK
jgi:Ca-activated chloride channel family protein